ncbi:MAG TPA: hypothetical protein VGN57_22225 [Pirellulaceae bacterium]|jgi:Tfp pilus assembly protein PilX|nr:hypothetical protein [Pirellulaceae bacterium]
MPRLQSLRRSRPRRRGYALIVALALLALGMGAAVVMLRTSDLSVRSTVRDDMHRRADRAAESALQVGLDVIRRRSWSGVDSEVSYSWLDGAAFRVRYLAGDASLSPSSADYAYYPYRVTVEATATVTDPSEPTAVTTSVATAVVELIPKKLQGPLSGWGERGDYAFFQFAKAGSTGEVKLEPPFQFQGKTRLSEPIKEWAKEYFDDDERRQPYLSGLKTMADDGMERRCFVGNVEYRFSDQPTKLRTDVTARLGLTEANVARITETVSPSSSETSYRLYPGGPSYAIPSFNSAHGSSPSDKTIAATDPATNPLGMMRLTSSATFKKNVKVKGILMASASSVSLTVENSGCSVEPPFAMLIGSRTLGLSLQSACVTDKLTIKKEADATLFRGSVAVWKDFLIEEGSVTQDVVIEGGLQCHQATIGPRTEFKNLGWNGAVNSWKSGSSSTPFPLYLESTRNLPSEPSIKIKKDVTGATAKFVFDPSRTLYDYPDANSGLTWRIVSLTPPH